MITYADVRAAAQPGDTFDTALDRAAEKLRHSAAQAAYDALWGASTVPEDHRWAVVYFGCTVDASGGSPATREAAAAAIAQWFGEECHDYRVVVSQLLDGRTVYTYVYP